MSSIIILLISMLIGVAIVNVSAIVAICVENHENSTISQEKIAKLHTRNIGKQVVDKIANKKDRYKCGVLTGRNKNEV